MIVVLLVAQETNKVLKVAQKKKLFIIKLSENIYFIGDFMKHVTVKQRLSKVVIWGTLIP